MGQLPVKLPAAAITRYDDVAQHRVLQQGLLTVEPLPAPISLDFRFHSAADCPYRPESATDQQWLDTQLQALGYFDQHEAGDRRRSDHIILTPEQLDYFKSLKPTSTACIFVHGFNVKYGDYGRQIASKSGVPTFNQVVYTPEARANIPIVNVVSDDMQLHWSDQSATVYRDQQYLQQQFASALDQLDITDERLNGRGAHNWWVHMENNLNSANGFLGFGNNSDYRRIINVAWKGDPSSLLDYMAVEPMAMIVGRALVPVIHQLVQAGISVNLIGHSAGCIVLIHAMNELALHPAPTGEPWLDHVFFWEAAMPDVVLSPRANELDRSVYRRWQTSRSHQAAKVSYVLYSHNDNILGPVALPTVSARGEALVKKYHSGEDGRVYALMALSIDLIDRLNGKLGVPNALRSVYNLAHLFHLPFEKLALDGGARRELYQLWSQRYRHAVGAEMLQPTLDEQVEWVAKAHRGLFLELSLFFSVLIAILQRKLVKALQDTGQDTGHDFGELAFELGEPLLDLLSASRSSGFMESDNSELAQQLGELSGHSAGFGYLGQLLQMKVNSDLLPGVCRELLEQMVSGTASGGVEMDVPGWVSGVLRSVGVSIERLLGSFLQKKLAGGLQWRGLLRDRERSLQRHGEALAALLITMVLTPGVEPRPAMGYSGPLAGSGDDGARAADPAMQRLIDTGRVVLVDQTDYLFQHGGMRVPTQALIQRVYRDVIVPHLGWAQ